VKSTTATWIYRRDREHKEMILFFQKRAVVGKKELPG